MKTVLRDKFSSTILVKPLYRKLKRVNKVKPDVGATVDRSCKLVGDEIAVKRKAVYVNGEIKSVKSKIENTDTFLPGACDSFNHNHALRVFRSCSMKDSDLRVKMLNANKNKTTNSETEIKNDQMNKLVATDSQIDDNKRSWLRVYPLPKLSEESVCSVVVRCVLCQLGLATILVLWTIITIFVIQSFEGPYEMEVSQHFEMAQDQLVINLATELRQITPVSPKWKNVIMKRIQEERQLTQEAVSKGARIHLGLFWDLSGTFLFIIYVMTALGFGAPVPQTTWGRTYALVYAVIAVPIHLYLMVNASMCFVTHLEIHIGKLKKKFHEKPFIVNRTLGKYKESPNFSGNSELLNVRPNRNWLFKKITCFLGFLGACRSVPLAILSYYACGAVTFGVLRGKAPLEVIMFPLEFTTTGGLNAVEGYVRIMYGFYIEGAMSLIACTLATLRRHSSMAAANMADKYRLFATEL